MYTGLRGRGSSPNVKGLNLHQPPASKDALAIPRVAKRDTWTADLAEEMIKLRSELAVSFFETIQRTSTAELASLAGKQKRLEELEQIRSRSTKDRLK